VTRTDARVVVIGESIVDVVHGATERERSPGGSPANVAVGLARLGLEARLVTRLGADENGVLMREHFRRAGVELEDVPAADHTSTAVATIASDGSASYEFDIDWSLPAWTELEPGALIHTGSIATFLEPGAASIRTLLHRRSGGVLVSYDPNIRAAIIGSHAVALTSFETTAGASDLVKLSAEDAAWLYPGVHAQSVLERILDLGVRLVALTDGEAGAHLATANDRIFVPSFAVEVVDTIGAGDTYMASLIASILSPDLSQLTVTTLREMGRRAAAAAGLCVAQRGAQPPTSTEIDRFLASVGAQSRRRIETSRGGPPKTSKPSRTPSTRDPGRPSAGRPPQKPSTSTYS
jgi:fructokinase